ncbi:hypothetical protein EON63_12500 [archaeon]|nr:MAG: hypothetical protein EON63_12500 [archaeon]
MRAHFGLPSITSEENTEKFKPVEVKFEIPYFTVSGLQVRYDLHTPYTIHHIPYTIFQTPYTIHHAGT